MKIIVTAFWLWIMIFLLNNCTSKISGPISNCFAYAESYSEKSKVSCDLCESGYILSDDEVNCDASTSNCQALDGAISSQCWSCNEGYMVSETDSSIIIKAGRWGSEGVINSFSCVCD